MIGAIIGDIVGSRFEFSPTNDYDFALLSPVCSYTDDTICTVAVADALLRGQDMRGVFRSLKLLCVFVFVYYPDRLQFI